MHSRSRAAPAPLPSRLPPRVVPRVELGALRVCSTPAPSALHSRSAPASCRQRQSSRFVSSTIEQFISSTLVPKVEQCKLCGLSQKIKSARYLSQKSLLQPHNFFSNKSQPLTDETLSPLQHLENHLIYNLAVHC